MQIAVSSVGSVFLALALGELYFAHTGRPPIERTLTPPEFQADPLLGWKPRPLQVTRAVTKVNGATVYDVTYSTDANGRRIAPSHLEGQSLGCLLFFADSFVFGDGVNDDETFPYLVGLKTRGRYRIVNFAANGYGAEHVLAVIERGDLATWQPCEPTHVLYAALPHHVHRAVGKDWSRRGPRYRVTPSGALEYQGTTPDAGKATVVSEDGSALGRRLMDQVWKSRIYLAWSTSPERTTESEIELYFAIVRKAYRLFKRRWPDAKFHLISWDIHDFYANGRARFHKGIKSVEATVHFIDDILPGYTKNPVKYGHHVSDLHPNAMAHEMVAAYLVERLELSTEEVSDSYSLPR
jgi:hypothetical protein